MEITKARPNDLPHIRQMIIALSAFHGEEAVITLEWLQTAFFGGHDHATAFVARRGAAYLGYAGMVHKLCLHESAVRFDLQHLFIQDSHRGTGVGSALIAAASAYVAERGGTGMTIGTDPDNTGAQAAYRAMGHEDITGKSPRFWVDATA